MSDKKNEKPTDDETDESKFQWNADDVEYKNPGDPGFGDDADEYEDVP